MGRKKKVLEPETPEQVMAAPVVEEDTGIAPLSIDYNNEGLNNIARKINEIIMKIN